MAPLSAESSGYTLKMIRNLVLSLDKSLLKKESEQIKALLTRDFIGTVPTGESFTRAQYIQFHCKPDEGLISIEENPKGMVSVRLYGNTAVVNRRLNVTKKNKQGLLRNFDVQRTEVLVQLKGVWYLATGQGTEVLKK